MSDSETIRQALDRYERWTEDAPEMQALCDAARAYADWLEGPTGDEVHNVAAKLLVQSHTDYGHLTLADVRAVLEAVRPGDQT